MELYPLRPDAPTFEDDYQHLAASESRFESKIGTMMLAFLDRLRHDVIGPRLGVTKVFEELWLVYSNEHGRSTLITARIDHKDYSPLVEGVPLMHYRLAYTRPEADNLPKVELRTSGVETACDFVLEAIRTCKGP